MADGERIESRIESRLEADWRRIGTDLTVD